MRRNCVLTIAVNDIYKEIAKLTHPLMKAYADKIGADFICVTESLCSSPHWEKFNQIYCFLNRYERIIYLDTDIIVRDDCPNLFEIVPEEQLGLFNEMPFTNERYISLYEACKDYGIILKKWNGKYYNTGVMVVSRCHKELFKKPEKEIFNFYEQGYFNAILAKTLESSGNELSVYELPYWFNRMTCMDAYTGEERYNSYIIHYAGYPSLEFVLSLIKKDIEKWKRDSPNYKYRRHILVDVQGGLGDQICAEPVIRFMKEKVYCHNEDINIVTHWPRIFKHLKLPVFTHDEFQGQPDTPYYHVLTLPGPETLMWSCVSHLMCHSVDYISMSVLKRILPNEDKRIKLEVTLEDVSEVIDVVGIRNLNDLVLVHPGRHWESKTFPVEWWQRVIEGLVKESLDVCLIGKDEKTRGTLEIEVPKSVIDTRNLLSLGGLFALISQAKVLISNDSAPVHIAGAFDNWIVLIPTCKHPDHILPYRYGSQSYKTKVLYKKLMCFEYESAPTTVYGSSAHFVPSGNFYDYLPEVDKLVEEVVKIFKEKD